MIVSVLAVLKAGGAYVPLDPAGWCSCCPTRPCVLVTQELLRPE